MLLSSRTATAADPARRRHRTKFGVAAVGISFKGREDVFHVAAVELWGAETVGREPGGAELVVDDAGLELLVLHVVLDRGKVVRLPLLLVRGGKRQDRRRRVREEVVLLDARDGLTNRRSVDARGWGRSRGSVDPVAVEGVKIDGGGV